MTETESARPLVLVVAGHVDHGKSTLIGRLLHDSGALAEGRIEAVRAMCARRGMPLEYAFLLDALRAERDQGVTIDTARVRFRTARRAYTIVDAPGHREFVRNMVSGAAQAAAAVLVVDAVEGMREQSRRHGYLLRLLGIGQVAVAVNKMDLAGYDRARFEAVAADARAYLRGIGIEAAAVVPVSARAGEGLLGPSGAMPWHGGPSLADALDAFAPPAPPTDLPLRLPVQDVYKFDERRIVAGRIESGRLAVGDTLVFSPTDRTARVASIESWNAPAPVLSAGAGQCVGIVLDEPVFVERGHLAAPPDAPPSEASAFGARLFWLGRAPLRAGRRYTMKLATAACPVEVRSIESVIDTDDLSRAPGDEIPRNGVGEVVLRARATVALDDFAANPRTGRFVLVDGYDTVAGGIVSMAGHLDRRAGPARVSRNIARVEHRVDRAARARANGHAGAILWLTGLSGAGKSTLAIELERRLFARGYQAYVLDGDNLRFGLSSDLGFAPADRAENIRRVGEVARLFAEAGFVVAAAFVSPYRADRDRARAIAPEAFHEVYVKADLAVCESRDPKGLYARARRGEIPDFTGVSAPYEEPADPELALDTGALSVAEAVDRLVRYVAAHFGEPDAGGRQGAPPPVPRRP